MTSQTLLGVLRFDQSYDCHADRTRWCVSFDGEPLQWFDREWEAQAFFLGLSAVLGRINKAFAELAGLRELASPQTELGQLMLAALRGDVTAALAAADRLKEEGGAE